jgi:DNA mismatch repair protein MutS2
MKDKSLEMLEFPKVREILAGYTSFAVSHERALALKPSTNADEIDTWMKQSREARQLMINEPDFSIGGIFDIRESTTYAARGKTLDLQTLVDVQRTLASMRYLHDKIIRSAEDLPLLSKLAHKMKILPELERSIGRCISPSAELLDSASDKLSELRRMLKEKRQQILNRLESVIKSKDTEKYIQDELITERDGRYVIPVKVEMRRELKGIVHDISNTGATAFVEPMVTIDMGNELRELVIEEQHEVERILAALSSGIGAEEEAISQNLNFSAEIDLILAKARYAERAKAVEPIMSGTKSEDNKINNEQRILKLVNARHPLLKGKPVPLNVEMGQDYRGLIITGPNTGGKTVALKTIGLLALMAQSGIPIPAASESCLPIFDNIYADIGDEQSIEQTLSTFSWHIGNIVRILKESTDKSLILLDELGTSTDPNEGAALAQSILLHFLNQGTMIVATTHFSELKAFAHATAGLQNASLDFDPVTLGPTFHLTIGIPGGSNALAIASNLGLPDEIISSARERLSKGSLEIETLLADLMNEKLKLESLRKSIQKEQTEAERLRMELQEEVRNFKEQQQELLSGTRTKMIHEGDELLKQIRDAMIELKQNNSKEKIELARKALSLVREELKGQAWQPAVKKSKEGNEAALKIGDKVWLRSMNIYGTIISLPDSNGQLEIQIGNTKVKLTDENLEKTNPSTNQISSYASVKNTSTYRTAPPELDLRGKRADEVETELEGYLNNASMANLPSVRIIHGVATGVVRQIVRQYLTKHPLVASFSPGKREEGGDGVTIASL